MKRLVSFAIICLLLFSFACADEIDNFIIAYNVYAESLVGTKSISKDMLDPSNSNYLFKLGNNTMILVTEEDGQLKTCSVYAENMDDLISCSTAGIMSLAGKTSDSYINLAGSLVTMIFDIRRGSEDSLPSSFGNLIYGMRAESNGWFMTAFIY